MATLPRFPVLPFLLFLGAHVVPSSHGTPLPPNYDGSMCSSESFWCGGVEIHYPFPLSNATREAPDHTRYSCGYTDLNISCRRYEQAWTPTILLGGSSYTVQNIFYNTSTIVLADSDAAIGGGCPSVRHNVSFGGEWLRLHDASSHEHNLTFFYGCYTRGDDTVPPVLDAFRVNCSGFQSPPGASSFVFVSSQEVVDESQEYKMAAAMVLVEVN